MKEATVGIGIAAHNEEANIGRLLENLLNQPLASLEGAARLDEIIVVTSGCTDRTDEIVAEFAARARAARARAGRERRVRHISEPERRGKSSAVNLILRAARGKDVLVMLSADNLPETGAVSNLVKPLLAQKKGEGKEGGEEAKVGAVSSRPTPVNDRATLFGFVSHLIWDLHYALSLTGEGGVKLTGEFYAIKPSLVREIPRQVVNDDLFVEAKIKEQGYKIEQALNAVSQMKGPETLRDFMRQRVRIHIGHYQIARLTGGYVPQTVKTREVLRALKKMIKLKKVLFFVAAILLEGSAKALAFLLFHLNKIPYKWDYAESTKKIGRREEET